jgi:hypothetical protein
MLARTVVVLTSAVIGLLMGPNSRDWAYKAIALEGLVRVIRTAETTKEKLGTRTNSP